MSWFVRAAVLLLLAPVVGLTECVTPGWGKPLSMETFEITNTLFPTTEYPDVAINDAGHAVAVWRDLGEVWSSRYSVFGGWTQPELIETEVGLVGEPQVEIDAGGNAIAVWDRTNSGPKEIWANRFIFGAGWGTAAAIAEPELGGFGSSLAMDSAGNAVVAFTANPGPDFDYQARAMVVRYTVGAGWDTPTVVDGLDAMTDKVSQGNIGADVNDDGDIIVAWAQERGSGTSFEGDRGIWANRYTAAAGWVTATKIHDDIAGERRGRVRHVAMDGAGNATAVFDIDCNGCDDDLVAVRYEPATGWASPEVIFAGGFSYVTVSARADDEVMVVWLDYEFSLPTGVQDPVVSSRRYTQGAWQSTQNIYPGTGDPPVGFVDFPQRVVSDMDADGNVIAVFPELRSGMPETLLASRFVVGVGWGGPVSIDNELPYIAPLYPAISVADDGAATVVWTERVDLMRQTWGLQFSP